jgi:hypothetical protein
MHACAATDNAVAPYGARPRSSSERADPRLDSISRVSSVTQRGRIRGFTILHEISGPAASGV